MHPLDILAYQNKFTFMAIPPLMARQSNKPKDWCQQAREARSQAILNGEKTYKTSWPCKNGHFAPKLVSTQKCIACISERSKKKGK